MELIRTIWALFLLFSLLAVPQLLGILAYYRVVKFHKRLAHLVCFLVPPATFYYLSWRIWFHSENAAQAHDGCGMAALAGVFIIVLGTFAQIWCSMLMQILVQLNRGSALRWSKVSRTNSPTGNDQVD